jgi:hypothetical protein
MYGGVSGRIKKNETVVNNPYRDQSSYFFRTENYRYFEHFQTTGEK